MPTQRLYKIQRGFPPKGKAWIFPVWDDLMKSKRPLANLLSIAEDLVNRLRTSCARIEIAGSLRRRAEKVGDIELVAIPRVERIEVPTGEMDIFSQEAEVKTAEKNWLWETVDGIADDYTKKGNKYRQFTHDGVQVDLFTAKPRNWGWIYLIRTGSAEFSHMMAKRLNQRGYTSRDGRIVQVIGSNVTEPINTPEEMDVFRLAGESWTEPYRRNL